MRDGRKRGEGASYTRRRGAEEADQVALRFWAQQEARDQFLKVKKIKGSDNEADLDNTHL